MRSYLPDPVSLKKGARIKQILQNSYSIAQPLKILQVTKLQRLGQRNFLRLKFNCFD